MKRLRIWSSWTYPWMILISILVYFGQFSILTGINQDVEYLPHAQNVRGQPLYLRNRNSFYEKYIRSAEDSSILKSNPNPSLISYPNINKDKGNVFKPKPLKPGPWIKMTTGEIWPKPKFQSTNFTILEIDINTFAIQVGKIVLLNNAVIQEYSEICNSIFALA